VHRIAIKIQRWHWGKIVILWAWGGLVAALLLTSFLLKDAAAQPTLSSLSSVGCLAVLGTLTAVTWLWLGGKDAPPPAR
jgi:hypothetical protein